MSQREISEGTDELKSLLPGFDYDRILDDLKDLQKVKAKFHATDIGYEKVQLFRAFAALNPSMLTKDRIFTKFVNETYHIENEYVMQLNPRDFDAVPEYVVTACKDLIETN